MDIVCIPGISKEKIAEIEEKLNNSTKGIVVLPYDCTVITVLEKTYQPMSPFGSPVNEIVNQ